MQQRHGWLRKDNEVISSTATAVLTYIGGTASNTNIDKALLYCRHRAHRKQSRCRRSSACGRRLRRAWSSPPCPPRFRTSTRSRTVKKGNKKNSKKIMQDIGISSSRVIWPRNAHRNEDKGKLCASQHTRLLQGIWWSGASLLLTQNKL